MRLVLANPHYYIYGKTVVNILLQRKHFMKYDYFLEYYLRNPQKKTAIFIDGTKTSLAAVKVKFFFFPKFFSYLELLIWMLCNRINPFKTKVFFDINELDPSQDVLVDFARSVKVAEMKQTGYDQFRGMIVFFCTHYFLKSREIAEYLSRIPYYLLVAEHNLSQEPFFQKFFPEVREVYQLPYAFGNRFKLKKPFKDRKNKCFALGSVAPIEESNLDFRNFFHIDVLQPMRKIIADQAKKYPDEIDSVVRVFENFSFIRNDTPDDSWFYRVLKRWAPPFILKIALAYRHNRYYKFDIVEKYNDYKMFVSGEEVIGLPPINAFEGMACGSAYLAIDHPMYRNIGLIPGIHYISYQTGDMEDLVRTIRAHQSQPEKLAQIARNGSEFVQKYFTRKSIADRFWHDLESMHQTFLTTKKIVPYCSFRNLNQ